MFLVASLCCHSFSFTVEILPDFFQDLTEALSDLDKLSKDCLKVKVREAFISDLPHQCQWYNVGKHQVYPRLGKVLLEGNYAFKWLVSRAAGCLVSDPRDEYLCKFSMYL